MPAQSKLMAPSVTSKREGVVQRPRAWLHSCILNSFGCIHASVRKIKISCTMAHGAVGACTYQYLRATLLQLEQIGYARTFFVLGMGWAAHTSSEFNAALYGLVLVIDLYGLVR